MKRFFTNMADMKNPLFQVILYENMITLTSTLVPLLCEALNFIFPSWIYIFPTGTLLLGIIQIFVGGHLLKANIGYLVGEKALEKDISNNIVSYVKKSKYVEDVTEVKAVRMGP
jgi:divalent metal cation (Fe/Co/Zn/Cd) transporter